MTHSTNIIYMQYVGNYALVRMHRRNTVVSFVSFCLYVCNSNFSEVAINQVLESTVWEQHNNISNLIVLDF